MVLEKIGIVASKSAKYLQACGKRSILETQALRDFNIKGLHFAPEIKSDVVQISENMQRWSKNPETYIPDCSLKNSQISMHHEINCLNISIRRNLTKSTPKDYILRDVRNIDKEMESLTPLEKDCIGYRGRTEQSARSFNLDFEIIKNSKVGDVIVPDSGYSYLAFDKCTATSWASDKLNSLIYEIRIPKGARVSRNLEHGGEIVMPRGAEYRLVSKKTSGNATEVVLEYIMPKRSNLQEIERIMKERNIPFEEPLVEKVTTPKKGSTIYDKFKI